ncbi:hypothetical protein SASPL_134058 [Salvia splendens]|uniref:Uncharacterized protein n=1 Tax=Salvia splendens TaxID=180675 RepID=A0A8X8X6W1_SALSN|nr:hypothetical protein SASPL_134058 [Salvia splendens]
MSRLQIGSTQSKSSVLESLIGLLQEDPKNLLIAVAQGIIPVLVRLLECSSSSELKEKSVSSIAKISTEDSSKHDLLAEAGGASGLAGDLEEGGGGGGALGDLVEFFGAEVKGEGEGVEESRRSSTCQPGSVSIKYSEMLLVVEKGSCAAGVGVVLVPLAWGGGDSGMGDAERVTPVRRNLVYIAEGGVFGGGLEEGEALVFAGELVGVVDTVVAGGAEGGLVGGAVQGCLALAADVAEDLHLMNEN